MFKIYRFRYVDRKTGTGWVFFARSEAFADKLAERISGLGIYNLRRTRIGFRKTYVTDIPPYELEMEQEECVEIIEKRMIDSQHSGSGDPNLVA